MARATHESAAALRRAGYVVKPFAVPDPWEFVAIYFGILSAEGGFRGLVEGLEGEAVMPQYGMMIQYARSVIHCRTATISFLDVPRTNFATRVNEC